MLSSILTLVSNSIATTALEDIVTSTSEEEEKKSIDYEQFSECQVISENDSQPILAMLEDKNKIIEKLQKQVENQKMQLTYYLKKQFNPAKIAKFSECASDESLPLNLAINKFYRQTGTKTKLAQIYERMAQLDCQISNTLQDQEFVLRKVVNRLCWFVREKGAIKSSQIRINAFGDFITDPLNINLFDKLLSATVTLQRKLDSFKICCDRVLIVEEERNEIVEQVYSIPSETRFHYNYLLKIQVEKTELEKQVKTLIQRRKHQKKKSIGKKQERCFFTFKSNEKNLVEQEEFSIKEALNKINCEAQSILRLTKEQKRKMKNSCKNCMFPNINQIIFYLKATLNCENMSPQILKMNGVETEEEIKLCQNIKCELNKIEESIYCKYKEVLEQKNKECEMYIKKIHEVSSEYNKLKELNRNLNRSLSEAAVQYQNHIEMLKAERDSYKLQVKDLQAIRQAYAKLVEKPRIASNTEREYVKEIDKRDKKIFDLETELSKLSEKIKNSKKIIENQKTQIDRLNGIIVIKSQNLSHKTGKNVETNSLEERISNCSRTSPKSKINKSQIESPLINKQSLTEKSFHQSKNSYRDASLIPVGDLPTKKILKSFTKTTYNNRRCQREIGFSCNRNDSKSFRAQTFKTLDGGSLTCFNIYSQKNGKTSGIVKAVVSASSDIKGNVKINDASTFSVEFKCKNQTGSIFDEDDSDTDEYELFRDCSKESLAKNYQTTFGLINC